MVEEDIAGCRQHVDYHVMCMHGGHFPIIEIESWSLFETLIMLPLYL